MTAALPTPLDWTGGPALAWVIAATALYLRGSRPYRHPAGSAERWRAAAFAAGLGAILLAVDSPLDGLADRLFWAHMGQHILLIGVAAPLLALARPWPRMWRGLPHRVRRPAARAILGRPGRGRLRAAAGLAGSAVGSWLIFNAAFCVWHLPSLYDATLRSGPIHALEHLTFFATALLLWTRVIDSPPWRSRLGEPAKLAYLSLTLIVGWILAIVLALATSPLYPAYAAEAARPGGISALTDQQLAGGMMWVPGSLAYSIAIVVIAFRWLEPGRERAPRAPARAVATGAR